MAALEEHEQFVKYFLSKKENTISDLSDILQERYPEQRGFSARGIKRFCQERAIRQREVLSDEQLDNVVKVAVSEVQSMLKCFIVSCCAIHYDYYSIF